MNQNNQTINNIIQIINQNNQINNQNNKIPYKMHQLYTNIGGRGGLRLRRFHAPCCFASELTKYDPYHARNGTHRTQNDRPVCAWLVLPLHPAWSAAFLQSCFSSVLNQPWWRQFCEYEWPSSQFCNVRISWKCTGKRVLQYFGPCLRHDS